MMANEELLPANQRRNLPSKPCCYWMCKVTAEAFLEEEDLLHYISRVERTINKSVLGAVLFLMSYTLSVMSLTIGFLQLHSCPCQPVLPVFLIVHGAAMSVRCLLETVKLLRKPNNDSEGCSPLQTISRICGILIGFWTITGSIWVYSMTTVVNTETIADMYYCDPLLYFYSLALVSLVISGFIFRAIFLIVISLMYCNFENQSMYAQLMTDKFGNFI